MSQKNIVDKTTNVISTFVVVSDGEFKQPLWFSKNKFCLMSSRVDTKPIEFPLKKTIQGNKDELSNTAESIIKAISEPFNIDGKESRIGCSIGIATFPESGTTIDDLLLYADKGMYEAKQKERGTYHF